MEGTRIVMVRHGESMAQARGVVGGHDGCRGLSDLGRQQAAALRDRWADTEELGNIAALYASVMPRAVETAEMLAPGLGRPDVISDCAFCEHHPGEGDGMMWEEFEARYPQPPQGWTPDHRQAPGSETWNEMAQRVRLAFDQLVTDHPGETVVVACHGGVIVQTMIRWLGIDPMSNEERAWFSPINSSVTEWRCAPNPYGNRNGTWELVRFNDHAHLAGTLLTP